MSFPALSAATQRFTLGAPRRFVVCEDESVLFLRSRGPTDASSCLWVIDAASGEERLLVDPRELPDGELAGDPSTSGQSTGSELPAEERARRERMRLASGGIADYSTSEDGRVVAFAVDGRLWVIDVSGGAPRQLAPELSGIYDPQVCADGSAVAFVAEGSVWAASVGDGLAGDGSDGDGTVADSALDVSPVDLVPPSLRGASADASAVTFGVAEFVAAEEMGRTRGHWWSPEAALVAFTRVDESKVTQWHLSEPALPELAARTIRYPAAGTANAAVELWVVAARSAGAAVRVTWDAQQFPYLVDVAWPSLAGRSGGGCGDASAGDAAAPLQLVVQSRDQRCVQLLTVEHDSLAEALKGGETSELVATTVHSQTDPVWVDLLGGVPRLTARGVLSAANHEGARALLLDGVPLTAPNHHVRSLVRYDDEAVIYTASTGPATITAFRVALPNAAASPSLGAAEPLAVGKPFAISEPDGAAAVVAGGLAGGTQTAVVTQATLDGPTEYRVFQLNTDDSISRASSGDHAATQRAAPPSTGALGARQAHSISSLAAVPESLPDVTLFASGEREVPTAVLWPRSSGASSAEPLPILCDPYGGPHGQRVLASRAAFYEAQWLADQGFCVVVADGRGTPGKNSTWEHAVAGDLLTAALEDQLGALDAVVERFGERVDATRVGIRGWSFGGYLAAGAVLRRPDRFHAAIAGAPVTDWRLYDTHYTERYLGLPAASPADRAGRSSAHAGRSPAHAGLSSVHHGPDAYERSSLLADAARLTRPLLLIHGFADDNVVAAHTLRLSAALLAAGAPHEVLPLSGVTHMASGASVAQHLMTHQLDFLRRHLGVSQVPPA